MTRALREVAGLGGFFAVRVDPPRSWTPLASLLADGLDARVDRVQAAFGATDRRASASVDSVALLSRIVSPALACAAVHGVVPSFDDLWWDGDLLGVRTSGEVAVGDAGAAARALRSGLVDLAVAPVVDAYADRFAVSRRVLWGNAASALAGAAVVLRPQAQPIAAESIVTELVAGGTLAGTGGYETPRHFRRATCCLYYRLPGGGLCGDCVLAGA